LEAAGALIDCLILQRDFYNAERFAIVTLDGLKDPVNGVDQESEAVAQGCYNLAHVIINLQDGDLLKAEMLARETLHIRERQFGNDHHIVGDSLAFLSGILRKQNKLGDEVKNLYERALAVTVKFNGPDSFNASIGHRNLGQYHHQLAVRTNLSVVQKREALLLSESYLKESVRIKTKIYGPGHHETITAVSELSRISRKIYLFE
jgi:hypothetical protein